MPEPGPRAAARGRIVAQRPAGDAWVTTAESDGPPVVPHSPCGGDEPCPWRRDAPAGQFPPEAYRLSAPTTYDQSTRAFGCHSSTPERVRVCAGWVLRGAGDNFRVRMWVLNGDIDVPHLPEGVELYDSYREMAIANGVAPDDPAIAPCRGNGMHWQYRSADDGNRPRDEAARPLVVRPGGQTGAGERA
ncbi:DUF6283 family protein [Streptomyces sp. NPDC056672]|uniref:DUF6283 family protein n=1 Tax=Streptomyces sp. NPDC056672 TaxID=3345906 RepID=UPI0036896E25